MPKEYKKIVIHPDGRVHPDHTTLVCEREGCTNEMSIADSFSFACHLSLTGSELRTVAQCDEEQHFCCSIECALAAHIACLKEHTIPKFQAQLAQYRERLSRQQAEAEALRAQQEAEAAAKAAAEEEAEPPQPE